MIGIGCEYLFVRCILQYGYYHVTYEFQSEYRIYSLPECHRTPCSKQAPYLNFTLQQWYTNPQPLSMQTNSQPFNATGQMIELCC